jgi:voltage-gated sodium channel
MHSFDVHLHETLLPMSLEKKPTDGSKTLPIVFNEQLVLLIIFLNVGVIYLHTFDRFAPYYYVMDLLDVACTLYFCLEITFKIQASKGNSFSKRLRAFHSDRWNRIDFYAVLIALPSIGVLFFDDLEIFTGFTLLRALRIFKIIRIVEYIPESKRIITRVIRAMQSVIFIIISFVIYSTIVSLMSVLLFKSSAPEHFKNAFDSFFTIFKVFSGDGFSDIVEDIQKNSSVAFVYFTKLYFVAIVFTGSFLGLSLINSIFVDQMASINQEENAEEDEKMQKEIRYLKRKIKEMESMQGEILEILRKRGHDSSDTNHT